MKDGHDAFDGRGEHWDCLLGVIRARCHRLEGGAQGLKKLGKQRVPRVEQIRADQPCVGLGRWAAGFGCEHLVEPSPALDETFRHGGPSDGAQVRAQDGSRVERPEHHPLDSSHHVVAALQYVYDPPLAEPGQHDHLGLLPPQWLEAVAVNQ